MISIYFMVWINAVVLNKIYSNFFIEIIWYLIFIFIYLTNLGNWDIFTPETSVKNNYNSTKKNKKLVTEIKTKQKQKISSFRWWKFRAFLP